MTLTLSKLSNRTSGMALKKGKWQVLWTEDGKLRTKSLCTSDRDEAIIRRDEFRADLIAKGATVKLKKNIRVLPDGLKYVYRRKPFQVKFPGGKVLGQYDTQEEAIAARNAALKIS